MPDAGEIKARIASVADTKKVTDAMYMISSVKMRRARRELQSTELYYESLRETITQLIKYMPDADNTYFHAGLPEGRLHFRHGIVLVTSDKGLAGSYNYTAIKVAEDYMHRHPETRLFIIGEYGRQYFQAKKIPFERNFQYSADFPTIWEAQEICLDLLDCFQSGGVDEINMIYTDYLGGKPSECRRMVLLPLDKSSFHTEESTEELPPIEFFPNPDTVLTGIIPSYLTGCIYSFLVDSYCSVQEARMTAMQSAGKNAEEMLKRLRMQYNSIRQAAITREMIEISSGAKALNAKREKQNGEGMQLGSRENR